MPGFNRAIIGGNLGRDPEVRVLQSGDKVCNFSIATSEKWTDKNTGEKKEHTDWHNIVCFNSSLIENVIEQYVHKGSFVIVEGKLKTRKWTDQQGVEKYTTEIVIDRFDGSLTLGPSREGGGGSGRDDQYAETQTSRYGTKQEGGSVNDTGQGMTRRTAARTPSRAPELDDDIPF